MAAEELSEPIQEFIRSLDILPGSDYSPFHPDLDEKLPVEGLLSESNARDVTEGLEPIYWVNVFRNSPAHNFEAEALMGQFVTAAMRAGQWMDIPVWEDQPLERITLPDGAFVDFSGIRLEYRRGAELLAEKGLAQKVTDDAGREWLRPTEQLLDFIGERLGPYGPRK